VASRSIIPPMENELEPKVPEILWKYRQWDKKGHAQAMIEKGEVYFALPDELNDPLDFHWLETRPESFRERRLFAKKLAKQRLHDRSARSRKKHSELWTYQLANEYAATEDGVMDTYVQITQGVLCCSAKNNDFLMWSHYSRDHRGICVGLLPANISIPFRECIYEKVPPVLNYHAYVADSRRVFVDLARTKSDRWKYEQEWRALYNPGAFRYPGCVASVVFGLRTDDATRDKVKASIERSEQPISMLQIKKVAARYELEAVSYDGQQP
jgi:hypothetical protein